LALSRRQQAPAMATG